MINGIKPFSLLDYPKHPAFVVFIGGCNFKCSYCHNKSIVCNQNEKVAEEDVFKMLEERKSILDAVVVSGGEPTIYDNKLVDFIRKLKSMNFLVKLDTNGSNPLVIQELLEEGLVDYIAMDLKSTFDKYSEVVGVPVDLINIKDSIRLIEESKIGYQFRTTVYKEMHSEADIEEIKGYLSESSLYIIQPYIYGDQQLEDIKYTSYTNEELKKIADKLKIEAAV